MWRLLLFLWVSMILLIFRWLMASLMMDALSSWPWLPLYCGICSASSEKISVSRPLRHRAASRDFSFLFSEFLRKEKIKLVSVDAQKHQIPRINKYGAGTNYDYRDYNYSVYILTGGQPCWIQDLCLNYLSLEAHSLASSFPYLSLFCSQSL